VVGLWGWLGLGKGVACLSVQSKAEAGTDAHARTRHVEGVLAPLGLLHAVLHGLALHQEAEAVALDLRLVHEDVLPAARRRDEAEALRVGLGLVVGWI